MNKSRRGTWLLAIAGLPIALLAGCSCEDSEPAQAPVVRQPAEQQPAESPEPEAEPKRRRHLQQPASQPREPDHRVGKSVIHAPADYLGTVTITAPRKIQREANLAYTQREIQQYNAMEGQYPESLEALEEWRGAELNELPKGYRYNYDSESGELTIVAEQ